MRIHLEGKPETEVSVDVVCEQPGEPACIHPKPHSATPPNFRGQQMTVQGSLGCGQGYHRKGIET